MTHDPPGYSRTQSLASVAHDMAQVAYVRLTLLERAFAALPGADQVDLEGIAASVLADLDAAIKPEEASEALRESLARMRRST